MKKRKFIFVLNILLAISCLGIYLLQSFIRYPQLALSQGMLYGNNNENLKDFEVVDAGIRSVSADPWIVYHLEHPVRMKVIELDISGVIQEDVWGEIFDTDTWYSSVYRVNNGKIQVPFYDKSNLEKQNLRFDLVASNSTYIEVEQIVINSRYGLICDAIKQLLLALVYVFLYETVLFSLYDFIKHTPRASFRKKLPACICAVAPAMLMGVMLLYRFLFDPIRDSLFIWMYLLIILSIMMMMLVVQNNKRNRPVFDFFIIFLGAFLNVGVLELLSGIEYNFSSPDRLFWNILLAAFPALILYGIIRNVKWSVAVSHISMVILAVINHYFFMFRGNPFELSDFLLANTALTVIGNYTFTIGRRLFFCLIFEFGMAGCLMFLERKKAKGKRCITSLAAGCLILVIGIVYSPDVGYWNMVADTQNYGYISSFVAYAKRDLAPRKPSGYTREHVQNLLETYEGGQIASESECPNIIVIMNEAFADLPKTYGFAVGEDGTPFIDSLQENAVKGDMLVSVFGGSTANTEYEFLTGNTMAFLSEGNVPYMQFVKSGQESLAHELKALGYQTIAFHPYVGGNYKRDKVYPLLGFEKFITEENELPYMAHLRSYMSDEADFMNLIDIYEKRDKGRPFFMFNVTMQNHGGYSLYTSEVDITVKPESEELQSVQLLEYLSLIRETDAAFEKLVSYFEKEDDKTIILMFGDHQPGLDASVYNAMNEQETSNFIEPTERSYVVPFVMWANYDIASEEHALTSANYMRAMLLETAGITLGSYDRFLLACQEAYPAVNRAGYYDRLGNFSPMADGLDPEGILKDYQMLQYANMFDKAAWKQLE